MSSVVFSEVPHNQNETIAAYMLYCHKEPFFHILLHGRCRKSSSASPPSSVSIVLFFPAIHVCWAVIAPILLRCLTSRCSIHMLTSSTEIKQDFAMFSQSLREISPEVISFQVLEFSFHHNLRWLQRSFISWSS